MTDDVELLRQYAKAHSEGAFAELVSRHLSLVYSAALRQVGGNEDLAKDVAQTVFIDLARKAGSLSHHEMLAGWLYTSTRFAAANIIRAERRRQRREQEAAVMQTEMTHSSPEPEWDKLGPVIDEAMAELSRLDRNTILLRFFEGKELKAVGEALSISEDAARMRVNRALDKLRKLLQYRGVTLTAAALTTSLATEAVTAVPAGLAVSIAGTALAATAGGGGTVLTILKLMTTTKLKLGIISTLLIAGLGIPLVIQHQAQVTLQAEKQTLRRQLDRLVPLSAENQRLSNLVAQMNGTASGSKNEVDELLRLRGEVTQLRAQARQLAQSKILTDRTESDMKSWLARLEKFKQRLEQMPDEKIPEFQLLTEEDWLNAVKNSKLETDLEFRSAFESLRQNAKNQFFQLAVSALRNFIKANDGQLPKEISQLKPYFASPVDDAILQRYEMLHTGKLTDVPPPALLVGEKDPIRGSFGNRFSFGVEGSATKLAWLEPALRAYSAANNGKEPTALAPLLPYFKNQYERDMLQQMMKFTGESNVP